MKNYRDYMDESFIEENDSDMYHGGKVKTTKKKSKIKDEFSKHKNKKLNKPKHFNKNDF